MSNQIYFIRDTKHALSPEQHTLLAFIEREYHVTPQERDYRERIDSHADTIVILYLNDSEIKEFIKHHIDSKIRIGILPAPGAMRITRSYGISKDMFEAIADIFDEKRASRIDLLTCNGEPAFTHVVISDMHGLNQADVPRHSIFKKLMIFIENLRSLNFKDYTITTAKNQVIQTAATGILVLEHSIKKGRYNLIDEDFSLHDGKLNTFILSPKSIVSYILSLKSCLVLIFEFMGYLPIRCT